MNFINRALLRFSLLPAGLYRKLGVDAFQLECIVATKLTIDDRRPNPILRLRKDKNNNPKPASRATLGTMLISFCMGCFYLVAFNFGTDIISQLTLYFSFFIILLAVTLLSDFTAVLLDAKDNYILLPKPVSDRTVLVARLVHIFIQLCRVVIPMGLPALIFMFGSYGVAGGLVFILITFLATLFSIFIINAVYLLLLKIMTTQRFQAVISYLQIILAIVLYGGYQLAPKLLGRYENQYIDLSSNPFTLLAPPYWFASGWKLLSQWNGSFTECIGAALCLVLPAVSIYIVIRFLAPAFNQKLVGISSSSSADTPALSVKEKKKAGDGPSLLRSLSRFFTREGAERMGFLFAWKITSRSREFKLKVYPSIGYMIVWVAIMWINNKNLTLDVIKSQAGTGKIIILAVIYMCGFMLMSGLTYLIFSDKYKASWIYYVAPIEKPGTVISGSVKAIIVKFFLPIILLVSVPFLVLIGPAILPNLLLGLVNQLLIAAMRVYVANKELPFSRHEASNNRAGTWLRGLSILLFMPVLGFMHYLIYDITPVVYILALLSAAATWYMLDSIKHITWDKIPYTYTAE